MQYGVCGGVDRAAALLAAGSDYIEIGVQTDLMPDADQATVAEHIARLRKIGLSSPVANGFIPGRLPMVGPEVDLEALHDYVEAAFVHACQAGVHTIVFGSGGARRVPEGFDRDEAWGQLVSFGKMIAPMAEQRDIVVVVEPLNTAECNILTTVPESARYVRDVDHPGVQLLVDAYHFARENEPLSALDGTADILRHAHIATYESRLAPGREDCDFTPFIQKLKSIGYAGRLSIEGRWDDETYEADVRRGIEILRELGSGSWAAA